MKTWGRLGIVMLHMYTYIQFVLLSISTFYQSLSRFRIMDSAALRNYLAQPPCGSAAELMRDAILLLVPGAIILLELVLGLRVNRRTRRSVGQVSVAYSAVPQPRWYGVLLGHVWSMYRLCLTHCKCWV